MPEQTPEHDGPGDMTPPDVLGDETALLARLASFCADLYRTAPVEGEGLVAQASEIAHAVALDTWAQALRADEPGAMDAPALTNRDVITACRLLIAVRRAPARQSPDERAIVRAHYPEVEAPTLDPLQEILAFYTALLNDDTLGGGGDLGDAAFG